MPMMSLAQEGGSLYGERLQQWRGLSHEGKQGALETRRAEWAALSPEEKAVKRAEHKANRSARRERVQAKPPALIEASKIDAAKVDLESQRGQTQTRERVGLINKRQNWNRKRGNYNN